MTETLSPLQSGMEPDETDPRYPSYQSASPILWLLRHHLQTLQGRRILDLACGAGKEEMIGSGLWYPTLLLLAASEGAIGVGIDIDDFPPSLGLYCHIRANLIPHLVHGESFGDLFSNLPQEYQPPFDVISCNGFILNQSPTIQTMLGIHFDFDQQYSVKMSMRDNLFKHALTLGKNGTVIVMDSFWYQIQENEIVEL